MIFLVRTRDGSPGLADVRVVHSRQLTDDQRELFCAGDAGQVEGLHEDGWTIVKLHDGWYPDELGGGVAVWGNGRYWEVRSSPFDVVAQD
jgi:hypothetical protein